MSAPKRLLGHDVPLDQLLLSESQAQEIVERAVKLSKADEIEVNFNSTYTGNTRFAANQMSTAGGVHNLQLVIQSNFGPKHAVVTTNDFSPESLERAVRQSEAIARLSPDDPENMPRMARQSYTPVNAWFDATAALTPDARAQVAKQALDLTRGSGELNAAGYLVVNGNVQGLGNSHGLFAYHRSTGATYTITVRTADGTGSGWAAADHPDWTKVDFRAVSARAADKARLSRNPVAVEPGRYTVILEPQATGDLVQLMAFQSDARSADEGRSPFTKQGGGTKVGEKIVDQRVTIYSDPTDPQLMSVPFDGEGFPLRKATFIENGVLKGLGYTRFWAQKQGKEPTGNHQSLKMVGTDTSVDEMIRGTQRGVLVTRLWYLRQVDPRTILYTGLTRDGTFLIENGKITKALRNFRFNESPLFILNNLEAIGRAERLAGTEAGGDVVMPSIKVKDFNFTSLSEAV